MLQSTLMYRCFPIEQQKKTTKQFPELELFIITDLSENKIQ